jgi:hypothetical protein
MKWKILSLRKFWFEVRQHKIGKVCNDSDVGRKGRGMIMKKGKRIRMVLEFYHRGKTKIPSVSFIAGDDEGLPFASDKNSKQEKAAFSELSKAAHEFCKKLVVAGELD